MSIFISSSPSGVWIRNEAGLVFSVDSNGIGSVADLIRSLKKDSPLMFGSIDLLRMKLMSDENSTEIGHHSLLRDLRRTSQSHPLFLVLSQPVTKQFTLLRPKSHRELLHKVSAETYPGIFRHYGPLMDSVTLQYVSLI